MGLIKRTLKRSKNIKIMVRIASGLKMKYRLSKGNFAVDTGNANGSYDTDESIHYIQGCLEDYKTYLGIEKIHGKVAEIGPGTNAGVALLMRKEGSERVDLIDRFFCRRDDQQQSQIYDALSKIHNLENHKTNGRWDDQKFNGVFWKVEEPAEIFFKKTYERHGPHYDYIVSRAVMEHLYNPLEVLEYCVSSLKPGGKIAHKIDFRDHGIFTPEQHELTFLTISSWLWRIISQHSGRPNRILVNQYRALLNNLKKSELDDYSILVTRLVGVGEIIPHQKFEDIDSSLKTKAMDFVEKHLKSFSTGFWGMKTEDLAVSGIFLTATKKME